MLGTIERPRTLDADAPLALAAVPAGTLRSVELFTGAGGLALATHLEGFHHRLLVEWDANACDTLAANAKADAVAGIREWQVVRGDVRDVPFADHGGVDLVAGGPPCQPFSIGGKHRGMDDGRDMIPQFVRAVREAAPRAFIMENVRGLTRPMFRQYFEYVRLQLALPLVVRHEGESWEDHLARLEAEHDAGGGGGLRYRVKFKLLNAADFGVPQTRERVFVVGVRADTGIEWDFPEPTHGREALLHDQWGSGRYWERYGVARPSGTPPRMGTASLQKQGTLLVAPWRTVRDAIRDLPEPGVNADVVGGFHNHMLRPGARSYKGHTGSPIDWPAKTLKAGDHGVPGGENMILFPDGSVRYFTVREAARIQTFPDSWWFSGPWSETMRQLGNAVPVSLARVVAGSVARALGRGVDADGAASLPRP